MKKSIFLQKTKALKVLVIGDVMLDRYIHGKISRRSPEADVPVVLNHLIENKIGGAGNVALNFRAFECTTHLLGIIGTDTEGNTLRSLLEDQGIETFLIQDPSRPTTLKTRVLNDKEHLLRVDFESQEDLNPVTENQLLEHVEILLEKNNYELVVLQDYNKGVLNPTTIERILGLAKSYGAHISVDPKKANFWAYKGVHLFKPNLKESREALINTSPQDHIELGIGIQSELECELVAITLSEDGIIFTTSDGKVDHVNAPDIQVVDVCGAGDAVLAILALGDYLNVENNILGVLSNQTGAQVCLSSGVVTVDPHSLEWVNDG